MNISRMQDLTKFLISLDSRTGHENEICDFLQQHLSERGAKVKAFSVDGGRQNLLATWSGAAPKILFNTHVDTVPQQYGPYADDERIYGRGACDTHGVLAAQLEAIEDLNADGVPGLGLLLVVGEETIHDGARHAAASPEAPEPEVLIVGEPTENKMMASQKGRLKADLFAYGLAGHSGYPEMFDSAVEKLYVFLAQLWQAPWLARDSQEGTTVNVIFTHSGGPDNQVPPFASARLMFRIVEPCEVVKNRVEEVFSQAASELPEPKSSRPHYELVWEGTQSEPISKLAILPDFETGTAAYNTDISYFGWRNCRTFLLGPGSILQAHRDWNPDDWLAGEWISKKEQIKGVELYKKLVTEIVSGK